MPLLTDIRPLRESPPYRRLWFGSTVSQFGQQMTLIAVAFEVYRITHSSFYVGLIGLAGLLPLVLGGLYGGALVDAFDRRKVALASSLGLWLCSITLLLHALLHWESVWLIYGVIAVQSAMFAVNSPARGAMLPKLVPEQLLPAANALNMASFNLGFTVGPLLGGLLIGIWGPSSAYLTDVVLFLAALYGIVRLPALPPEDKVPVPGLRSVVEGLRFLRDAPNLRMTFIVDLCAMVFAQPRSLFPALAATVYAGSFLSQGGTLGLLQSSPAIGSLIAFAFSGWIAHVHAHGRAVVLSVIGYGTAVALAGVAALQGASLMWLAVAMLAASGAADMVSAAYRSTMLQTAAPDELRGRMQGVFTVVVAGGPRLGDFFIGSLGDLTDESRAMLIGGLLCIVGVLVSAALSRRFLAYDARNPAP